MKNYLTTKKQLSRNCHIPKIYQILKLLLPRHKIQQKNPSSVECNARSRKVLQRRIAILKTSKSHQKFQQSTYIFSRQYYATIIIAGNFTWKKFGDKLMNKSSLKLFYTTKTTMTCIISVSREFKEKDQYWPMT